MRPCRSAAPPETSGHSYICPHQRRCRVASAHLTRASRRRTTAAASPRRSAEASPSCLPVRKPSASPSLSPAGPLDRAFFGHRHPTRCFTGVIRVPPALIFFPHASQFTGVPTSNRCKA